MSGPLLLPRWDELAVGRPVLVATMRRYLAQIACTLRPGSVKGSDLGLRCFATFLAGGTARSTPSPRCAAVTSRTTSRG